MSGRVVKLGLGAAGVAGAYYLYNAGGNPKVAEKQIEHDAARLSSSIKSELSGKEKEVKTGFNLTAQEAGAKFDSAYERAKAEGAKLENSVRGLGADAQKKASEAQSSISSWTSSAQKDAEKKAEQAKSSWFSWSSSAQKSAEQTKAEAEKKAADAQASLSKYADDAAKKADELRRQTGTALTGAVDKFDSTVEKGASQAKSSISSWFGSK